jgi:hypothetical protein
VGDKPYIHWHLDYLSRKGVAIVEIETPKGPVAIANTHLQSTYTFGDYTFVQLAQVLTLAGAIESVDGPLVLVGDINAEPQSIVSQVLVAKLGLTPASTELGIDIAMARGPQRLAPHVALFQHLFEDNVVFENGRRRTLSDHPCLMIDYDLGPCPACEARPPWSETRPSLERFLADNSADTTTFMWIMKALAGFTLALVVWLGRLGRQRKIRGRKLLMGVGALLVVLLGATWFAYVGWSYCPDKLAILSRLRSTVAAPAAAR